MTLVTFSDGKVVMKDGSVGTETACCCGGGATACDCPASLAIGNNSVTITFSILVDAVPWGTCDACITGCTGGTLTFHAAACVYYGDFVLDDCFGAALTVRVYFDIGGFPACACQTTGDDCTYAINAWTKTAGAANVTIDNVITSYAC